MKPYRTIYELSTGKVLMSKRMSDSVLSDYLSVNTSYGSINGICPEISNLMVDLDTLTIVPKPAQTDFTAWMRDRRNKELTLSDWTVGPDSPLSDAKKAEWETYRQALRDLPDNITLPVTSKDSVAWPGKPA